MKFFTRIKEFSELMYWKYTQWKNHSLTNTHYKPFFTEYFALTDDFYRDKTILDIGCGPRGSLEWANMTQERIGLDPLAHQYQKLGADQHNMTYIQGYVENLPFPDAHFDVVSSFNSLDHVENLERSCQEIIRVIQPGGLFLLIVDIHPYKTLTEPQILTWDLLNEHFSDMEILEENRLKRVTKTKIYTNVRKHISLNDKARSGVLTAKLRKPVS